ncbi:hypothetical protein ACFLRG_01145 [Bacteroidota bacterium]
MKKSAIIFCLSCLVTANLFSQQDDFPVLNGHYIGQKPPGMKPEPFAEDIPAIYRFIHSGIIFSPDGSVAYWKPDWNPKSPIYFSRVENGYWASPRVASFSKENQGDDSPFISPDGKKLFFISQRAQKRIESIWVMNRTSEGWSEPELLPDIINSMSYIHWQFSADFQGNLYFGAGIKGDGKEGYIYISKFNNGQYSKPKKMGPEINQPGRYNYSPFIYPDGNTLIFTRNQNPAKLFVSFKKKSGSWTEAKDLSGILNNLSCLNPFVTNDGKYLFFLAGGYPYWVSAKIIDELRPNE